jgi:hypothetical protein
MDESFYSFEQLSSRFERRIAMFGEQGESHEMVLEVVHPSGAEEWYCPTCGQRFLLKWPPFYNKIFLETGNLLAAHTGERAATGSDEGASSPTVESFSTDQGESVSEEERRLEPWLKWFEEINFDHLWSK